ncbi:hypothetical protein GCM10010530_43540 [Kribbella aluminosa]
MPVERVLKADSVVPAEMHTVRRNMVGRVLSDGHDGYLGPMPPRRREDRRMDSSARVEDNPGQAERSQLDSVVAGPGQDQSRSDVAGGVL